MADGSRYTQARRVRATNPAQHVFAFGHELIVDLFAGGGGASIGIEQAFGRPVDIAINHNRLAVDVHTALHPNTEHYCEDVYAVDPSKATRGRPVGLLHASPDCTHHSQAKGGQPRSTAVRALSWVVIKWAGRTRPRVITLENVHQITQWCPLIAKRCKATGRVVRLDGTVAAPGEHTPRDQQFLIPDPSRRGQNWRHLVAALRGLGYAVEWRRLKACDYGAGTRRDRLYMIARCDGLPIRWPAPSHAPRHRCQAKACKHKRRELPRYVAAGDCMDWSIPACSIFATQHEANAWAAAHGVARPKRPLKSPSLRRIARGVKQYVVDAADPYFVPAANDANSGAAPVLYPITHTKSGDRAYDPADPLSTITTARGGEIACAIATMVQAGHGEGKPGGVPRWGSGCTSPLDPTGTITASAGGQAVATAFIERAFGKSTGNDAGEPLGAITAGGGGKAALVAAFLEQAQGGFAADNKGNSASDPLSVITTRATQLRLVTAHLETLHANTTATSAHDPVNAVTAGGKHHQLIECTISPDIEVRALRVAAFLINYYGQGKPRDLAQPLDTITTKDRLALVTVWIAGDPWYIVDICMRMLAPHELARCQGFPPEYPLTHRADGRPVSKTDQVRLIGNSVSPPVLRAIVAANVGELLAVERRAAA